MARSVGMWRVVMTAALLVAALGRPVGRADAQEVECGTPRTIKAEAQAGAAPSEEFVAGIETLVETVAACQSEGEADTLVKIVTPGYLGDTFAGGGQLTVDAFLALAPDLPRVHLGIRSVENVRVARSGNVSAVVTAVRARQLIVQQWRFVEDASTAGRWRVDGVAPLPVPTPEGADTAEIELRDRSYSPERLRVTGPSVVIAAENVSRVDHELLVLQIVDEDVTVDDLLSATEPGLPDGVRFVGQQTVLAGESAELVLVTLKAGEYVIVDLLPTEDGIPNLSLGMEAELIVR